MHHLPIFDATNSIPANICIRCRGTKFLCGKPVCPVLVKYYASEQSRNMVSKNELDGLSPPGIFVGRYGYPKVHIGPFLAPEMPDASILDAPERWVGKGIEEIAKMRFQLVRGKYAVDVHGNSDRIFSMVQEIALSREPAELEIRFRHPPRTFIAMDDNVQPFGFSGVIERISAQTGKFDSRLEKAYQDNENSASEAIFEAYSNGAPISSIQRAFSAGCFGRERERRMVPTRWSITAVDDTVGRHLLEMNKSNPVLDTFRIYRYTALDNRWIVLMMPTPWRYELIEAWFPNTTWNPFGTQISMISSHEFFQGRREYAEIGGCYYAARLAVNELFSRERIQAGTVILREAHPGYIMPVGVWNVREHVRQALKQKPLELETIDDCIAEISRYMDIPISRWIAQSSILRDYLNQRRLTDFTGEYI
jgi:hypothetical protein